MQMNRRAVMRKGLVAAGGAVFGALGASALPHLCGWDRPPLVGGYAAAADVLDAVKGPGVTTRYYVETTEPVVAFTFDD